MSTVKRHPVMVAGFGVILAAVVAFSLYLGVSITTANEGKKFIEFEGKYEGSRTIDFSTPGILLVMTTDTGDIGLFGKFTRTGFLVEDSTITPERCDEGLSGGTGIAGLVTYAFDKDILILKRTGASICLDFADDVRESDVLLDFEVIGGTGRFEGAKGKIKEHVTGNLDSGVSTAELRGRIRIGDND